MNYQKIKQKIKFGAVAAAMTISSLTPSAAFADELFPGYDPVPLDYSGAPVFYISKIDQTNNEVEFKLYTEEVDYSSQIENVEVRWSKEARNDWGEVVFSNDSTPFSEYYTEDDYAFKKYVVGAEVNLWDDQFYIWRYTVTLTDGSKWANYLDFSDCGPYVAYGMGCEVIGNMFGEQYNTMLYGSVMVEVKERPVEPEPEPVEPEPVEPEPELVEPEPEPVGPEPTELTEDLSDSSEGEVIEVENETPRTIERVVTVASFVKNPAEETEVEELENDAEVQEGSGNTTLDVPLLGGKTGECGNSFWWLPYFLGGAVLGTGLTLFLFFIFDKHKKNRTYLI